MFLGAIVLLIGAVGGYVAWRDRGSHRAAGARFDGHGEGKSAAYLAGYDRGIDDASGM